MCLDTVDKEPKMTEGMGWKVVDELRNGWVRPLVWGLPYRVGVWQRDTAIGFVSGGYPKGYHVCTTRKGAEGWLGVIRQCKFREVVATGTQDFEPVAVAKEIYILKRSEE